MWFDLCISCIHFPTPLDLLAKRIYFDIVFSMVFRSMRISGYPKLCTIFQAIFSGDIPLHRPYIGLIYARYLQWIGSWVMAIDQVVLIPSDVPRKKKARKSAEWHRALQLFEISHQKLSATSWVPSGYVKIAIENGHRNSGFTHEKWWFSIVMLVYQRVANANLWVIRGCSSNR